MVLPRLDGQGEGMSVYLARVFLSGCSHILPKPAVLPPQPRQLLPLAAGQVPS